MIKSDPEETPTTNWNLAPPEILEKIFTNLSFDVKMKAMQVSTMWYNVLQMEKFIKNSCLTFEYCYIDENCEPWKTFLKLDRKIKYLKIGRHVSTLKPNKSFWKSIGRHVERVAFTSALDLNDGYLCSILSYFPRVQEVTVLTFECLTYLTIPNTVHSCRILSRLAPEISPDVFLKDIFVTLEGLNHISAIYIQKTCDFIYTEGPLMEHEEDMVILFYEITLPDVSHDAGNYLFLKRPLNILGLQPTVTPDMVSKIEIWNRNPLDDFINLEQISIHVDYFGCFFVHNPISLLKLKILEIHCEYRHKKYLCLQCIEMMAISCPNVDSLKFYAYEIGNFEHLMHSIPKPLKSLRIVIKRNSCPEKIKFSNLKFFKLSIREDDFNSKHFAFTTNYLADQMLNLRALDISRPNRKPCKILSISQVMKICPNLEIFIVDTISCEDVIKVEEMLPSLMVFKFRLLDGESEKTMLEGITGKFWRLKVFGYPDEELMCDCWSEMPEEYQMDLFKKIPSLRQTYFMDYNMYQRIQMGFHELPETPKKKIRDC